MIWNDGIYETETNEPQGDIDEDLYQSERSRDAFHQWCSEMKMNEGRDEPEGSEDADDEDLYNEDEDFFGDDYEIEDLEKLGY